MSYTFIIVEVLLPLPKFHCFSWAVITQLELGVKDTVCYYMNGRCHLVFDKATVFFNLSNPGPSDWHDTVVFVVTCDY